MKITAIRRSRHRLPLDPAFTPAWDSRPRSNFDVDLVRVETDEGLVGIGSGDSMPGFEGHESLFLGEDPLALDRHFQVIENLSFHYGRCWPLDLALWDLAGKIAGQPVWRMLGGASGGRLRCYASTGTLRPPQATAEAVQAIREAGFPAVKLRFHRPHWRDDVAVVEAVRASLGGEIEIMVDCNQAWRMPWDTADPWHYKDALGCARALEDLNVFWMEEPLHRANYRGMADLRQAVEVRIAGAEMAREIHDLTQLLESESLDVLQPDAAVCGGITGLSRVFQTARARGVEIAPHTWGNGIGLLANAHLAAGVSGCPFLEFPYDPPSWTPRRRDFILQAPVGVDGAGWLHLGDAPGLGLALDEERLRASQIA